MKQQQQPVSHIPIVVVVIVVVLPAAIAAAARIEKLRAHVRAALLLQPAPEVLCQRARLQCRRHRRLLDTVNNGGSGGVPWRCAWMLLRTARRCYAGSRTRIRREGN
jgi:hypothetical protein